MIENFDELVARCENRRRRQMIRLSLMIVASILFVIAAISGFQMWYAATQAQNTPAKPASIVPPPSSAVTQAVTPADSNATMAPTPPAAKTSTVPVAEAKPTTPTTKTLPEKSPLPAESIPQPKPLLEVNAASKTAISDPTEAYRSQPKYETALAVARDYYAKNNYTEAAVWAKKANQMNREGDEAWLLYAKSYYAQGRKAEAISVLELYLNYKDSKAAIELLRAWKSSGE